MQDNILLEDMDIFQLAIEIGEDTWNIVETWDWFAKKTVGEQFVRAADSVAANIAEGYGRYFYRDRRMFCYYARGSMLETKAWANKSLKRKLVGHTAYEALENKMKTLHYKLNIYIKKLKQNIIKGSE